MVSSLVSLAEGRRVLLVVAARAEARAILPVLGAEVGLAERAWELHAVSGRVDLVVTGVGKANAAGATGRLLDSRRHGVVLSAGVGGSLPGSGLKLGELVAASSSVFADEGFEAPGGFTDIARRGFPPGPWEGCGGDADPGVLELLRAHAGRVGIVATVSTCSGTDALAGEIGRRTGAMVEAMEGAAVAATASRLGVRFGELRSVSNNTGSNQTWDLRGALSALSVVLGRLLAEG